MILRAGQFEIVFPRSPIVMGVVNVTPDSFSDGGRFYDVGAAIAHGRQLVEQGAEILDIGGESTRPKATPVPEDEEIRRVLPVLRALVGEVKVPLSIDTQKPGVARAALAAGASMVNDIAANRTDPEMWKVVADSGAAYVAMHMQGTPQTMQNAPCYTHVVNEVAEFFQNRIEQLMAAGIGREQIILDVGIGFGKGLEHNLQLLAQLSDFRKFGRPLVLGVSRKSFMGKLLGAALPERMPASLACACWAINCGVEIIRAHDVFETCQAVRMTEEILKNRA
jgi:dihydropteroate synthase